MKKKLLGVLGAVVLVVAFAVPVMAFADDPEPETEPVISPAYLATDDSIDIGVYYTVDPDLGTKTINDGLRIKIEWELTSGVLIANTAMTWDAENLAWVESYQAVGTNGNINGAITLTNFSNCDVDATIQFVPAEAYKDTVGTIACEATEYEEVTDPLTVRLENSVSMFQKDYSEWDFMFSNACIFVNASANLSGVTLDSADPVKVGSYSVALNKIENFTVTAANRAAVGFTSETEDLVIPKYFTGDGNNGTVKDKVYRVNAIANSAFGNWSEEVAIMVLLSGGTYTEEQLLNACAMAGYFAVEDIPYVCTPCALKSVTIPDSVEYIGYAAFDGCADLESFVVEDSFLPSLQRIGAFAFKGCSSLAEVVLPDTVSSIGQQAFYGTALTEFTLPGNTSVVTKYMLGGCSFLESVDLGYVTEIEEYAFYNSTALETASFEMYWGKIGDNAFDSPVLSTINYGGYVEDWDTNELGICWDGGYGQEYEIVCQDDTIVVNEEEPEPDPE